MLRAIGGKLHHNSKAVTVSLSKVGCEGGGGGKKKKKN